MSLGTFLIEWPAPWSRAAFDAVNRDIWDLRVAVLGEERDGAGVLRLHHNPLAPWIWFGPIIMALGAGLSLSDRRMRVAAPAPKGATAPA
jgi:cytochrome c-type biogenesis protein CcmF